jgi:hypothetical protein
VIKFAGRCRRGLCSHVSRLVLSKPHLIDVSHVQALENLGKELGYSQLDDWYRISTSEVNRSSVLSALLPVLDWSPSKVVASIIPNHHWLPWKFKKRSRLIWESPLMRRTFFEWLYTELALVR